jgi:hypothetical protein
MVVAGIVNAISRKKIEDAPPFRCVKLRPDAPFIADVHLEHVEQLSPLRIHALRVKSVNSRCWDSPLQKYLVRILEGVEVEFPEKLTRRGVLATGYRTLWSALNIPGKYRIRSEF